MHLKGERGVELERRCVWTVGVLVFVCVVMAHLVKESSGDVIYIPEGDSIIGRGPLLNVCAYKNFFEVC